MTSRWTMRARGAAAKRRRTCSPTSRTRFGGIGTSRVRRGAWTRQPQSRRTSPSCSRCRGREDVRMGEAGRETGSATTRHDAVAGQTRGADEATARSSRRSWATKTAHTPAPSRFAQPIAVADRLDCRGARPERTFLASDAPRPGRRQPTMRRGWPGHHGHERGWDDELSADGDPRRAVERIGRRHAHVTPRGRSW